MHTAATVVDSAPQGFRERGHVRRNDGWLAGVEARVLDRLARRLPPWINSDHLSALGLAGMAGAGASFVVGGSRPEVLPLAIVALAVNWFGDSLDGTLARVRRAQRPNYGYYLDHVLDIVGIAMLMAGMAAGGVMSPLVAVTLLCAYVAVMAETFLATYSRGTFAMAFLKFGPTELRVVLAFGVIALLRSRTATLFGHSFLLFDVGGLVATAGLALTFVVSAVRNGRALYAAEPLPSHLRHN